MEQKSIKKNFLYNLGVPKEPKQKQRKRGKEHEDHRESYRYC